MRAVLHRDVVKVSLGRIDRRGRAEGHVLEIVERPVTRIIGRLLKESGVWLVAPEDKRYAQDVIVQPGGTAGAEAGKVVVAELTEPPALFGQPVGHVIEVLGDIDDPGMEIDIAVRKFNIPHEFSPGCEAETKTLPDTVRVADKRGRIDLTDVPLVTIDGADARDFDDAVYCEPVKIGRAKGWRLLVAIADVSHYVKSGGDIDTDAFDRATSVYFPRRVVPMLPEKLSNGLCSLNPDVDRLCMVCDMMITAKGELHAYQFYPAVMHSHARFTYDEVWAILQNTRGPEAAKRGARVTDLLNLHDLYKVLAAARKERGAMEFETVETQIISNDNGRIERIEPRTRNDAHKLIEEAMLAANVCAADFIEANHQMGLYRVHEGPTPEKAEILREYLKALGISARVPARPSPKDLAAIAAQVEGRPDAQQIQTMLLRSMQQAIYTPDNAGHFGLAFEAYTHFTSPIRRYPDLLVHRVIKSILQNKVYELPSLPEFGEAHENLQRRLAKSAKNKEAPPPVHRSKSDVKRYDAWVGAGLHCSANERRADEASRDVENWLKCRYMKEHLGEQFTGTVSGVTSFGLFVMLDQMYVEGLVHVTELGGDYYRYDELRQELRGERTGVRYHIGTKLEVQVSRVDLDGRRIDFRLAGDDELRAAGPRNGKGEDERGERGRSADERKGKSRKQSRGQAKAQGQQGQGNAQSQQGQPSQGQQAQPEPKGKPGKTAGRAPARGQAARSAGRTAGGQEPACASEAPSKRRKSSKRK